MLMTPHGTIHWATKPEEKALRTSDHVQVPSDGASFRTSLTKHRQASRVYRDQGPHLGVVGPIRLDRLLMVLVSPSSLTKGTTRDTEDFSDCSARARSDSLLVDRRRFMESTRVRRRRTPFTLSTGWQEEVAGKERASPQRGSIRRGTIMTRTQMLISEARES